MIPNILIEKTEHEIISKITKFGILSGGNRTITTKIKNFEEKSTYVCAFQNRFGKIEISSVAENKVIEALQWVYSDTSDEKYIVFKTIAHSIIRKAIFHDWDSINHAFEFSFESNGIVRRASFKKLIDGIITIKTP